MAKRSHHLSEGEKKEQVHASVHRSANEGQAACAFVAKITHHLFPRLLNLF